MNSSVSLFVARWISRLLQLLPKFCHKGLGHFLGWVWFDAFRIRRQVIDKNIHIVYPDMTPKERTQLGRRALHNLGRSFIETLMIPSVDQKFIDQNVEFHGEQHIEQALQRGQGVLLLSVHIGSVDLGTISLGLKGYKVHLLSKEFKSRWLNDFWFGLRRSCGIDFIKPHGTESSFAILRALKRNEAVMFVIDQFMGRPYGITARFFGVETGTPYGLALFHLKTEAPVIPVYTYRDEDGKTHVVFEKEVPLSRKEDRDQSIAHMVDVYNGVVEKLVLRHPDQWMWVHDRWKRKI